MSTLNTIFLLSLINGAGDKYVGLLADPGITVNYIMSSNPIPHKSDQLFYVQLDNWDPNDQGDDGFEPPDQVTYLDAMALMKAGKAYRQVASNRSGLVLEPQGDDEMPFSVDTRNTWADFFPMFDLPFIYGGGWDDAADQNLERVVGFIFSRAGFTADAEEYCREKGIACSEDERWLESGK